MTYQKEVTPYNFGGLEGQTFAKAKTIVLPVPYAGTVSYGSGTDKGPHAIIESSRHMELYDMELDCEPYKTGIFTEKFLPVQKLPAEKMLRMVEKKYGELVAKNKFVAMLGGEHSISPAVTAPLCEKYPDLSILQWDAHADLRDSWEGTKFSHACAMRRFYSPVPQALGEPSEALAKDGKNRRIVQVGIRSMSVEEADFIKKTGQRKNIFTPQEFNVQKILNRLTQNVYITIDLDGFDPSILPATGTPEPGGLNWQNFLSLMRTVFNKKNVVGFDVVELAPIKNQPASDFLAALAVYKMIAYKFDK